MKMQLPSRQKEHGAQKSYIWHSLFSNICVHYYFPSWFCFRYKILLIANAWLTISFINYAISPTKWLHHIVTYLFYRTVFLLAIKSAMLVEFLASNDLEMLLLIQWQMVYSANNSSTISTISKWYLAAETRKLVCSWKTLHSKEEMRLLSSGLL